MAMTRPQAGGGGWNFRPSYTTRVQAARSTGSSMWSAARTPDGHWIAKPPMPMAVSRAAVAAMDGVLYIAGGMTATGEVAVLQAYVASEERWKRLASMPEGRERGCGAQWLKGEIYVIGGWS